MSYVRYPFARKIQLVAHRRPVVQRPGAQSFRRAPAPGFRMGNDNGLGLDWDGIFEAIGKTTETVTQQALPAYLQYRTYRENLARSKAGLAPLDVDTYAPSMRVQVQPDTRTQFTLGGIGLGVLALGGVALFMLMRRR